MATNTPNVNAPIWEAAQASPWLTVAQAERIFDAFAVQTIVDDRSLNAPPVSCADGARYLIAGGATGAWSGHSGQLAIAVGANASNGWLFAVIATEGSTIWIRDELLISRYRSSAWHDSVDGLSRIQDMLDVSTTGLVDGATLIWDASNGVFFPVVLSNVVRTIGFQFTGSAPTASEVLALYPVVENLTLPANLSGSRFSSLVSPTTDFTITISKQTNGTGAFSTIATVVFHPDGSASLSTSGGTAYTFQSGDVIKAVGDSDGDATMQGAFTLRLLIG